MQRFFRPKKSYKLAYLLKVACVDVQGNQKQGNQKQGNQKNEDLADTIITDTGDLMFGGVGQIGFFSDKKYSADAKTTKLNFVITTNNLKDILPSEVTAILVDNPRKTYALIKQVFYPREISNGTIHKTALVEEGAVIEKNVELRAYTVIKSGAVVKFGAVICEHAVIGNNVIIGENTIIGINNSVEFAVIGKNCFFHANISIGTRGFGFVRSTEAPIDIPHTGAVVIEDNVEIGSGTSIDRGAEGNTFVGEDTRIDNLVHMAHNVVVGKRCSIAGQVGFGGSAVMCDDAVLAGQVGVAQSSTIGKGAVVLAKSGVTKNVPDGAVYVGFPARESKQWFKDIIKENKNN